jgi:hypothetical protein
VQCPESLDELFENFPGKQQFIPPAFRPLKINMLLRGNNSLYFFHFKPFKPIKIKLSIQLTSLNPHDSSQVV